MRNINLSISLDCGVLDSGFPGFLEMVEADLQDVVVKLRGVNVVDPKCANMFLVIRYLDDSNTYVARRLQFQEERSTIYADVVVRSSVLNARASFADFVLVVFEMLRTIFHEAGLFSKEKGIVFNDRVYLEALGILEKFYSETGFKN